MNALTMPKERYFGWQLKSLASTKFGIHQKDNGQFCVVLNHSLIRGINSEMLHWWFLNFPNLTVNLVDIEGYEGEKVPAYLLWHPSDHLSVSLSGNLGARSTSKAGGAIEIKEAMQYLKYGWKCPVDDKLRIFYCEKDGWAMGKTIPFLGRVMSLRIHYKDVYSDDDIIGVHYHYEILIGVGGNNPNSRFVNQRITSHFSPEFFEAWHTHNAIEAGTFENFLPALYEQRHVAKAMKYAKAMNAASSFQRSTEACDPTLFEQRMKGYEEAEDAHAYQGYQNKTFL